MIKSSTMIGGSSTDYERNAADFYPTPAECTVSLYTRLRSIGAPTQWWEPACGDGAICKVLAEFGCSVHATDLHDRGYGASGHDFLTAPDPGFSGSWGIITNPPFNLAESFIRRAAQSRVPFAMLLKATYWHAKSRHELFKTTGPAAVFPMTWRPHFAPERGNAPTMDMCWTYWAAEPVAHCIYEPMDKRT